MCGRVEWLHVHVTGGRSSVITHHSECACVCVFVCGPIILLNMESAICYPAETALLFINIFQLIIHSPKEWPSLQTLIWFELLQCCTNVMLCHLLPEGTIVLVDNCVMFSATSYFTHELRKDMKSSYNRFRHG